MTGAELQVDIPLDAILDTVLDGIITIDPKGMVLSFSSGAQKIFGYAPDEVIGKNINILMPEPYHGEHDGYVSNYVTSGTKKIIGIGREVAGKRKNGSIFPMELGVNEAQAGDHRLFVGIVRDITEKKQLMANLAGQMAAIDKVQAIIELDLDGRILSANRIFLEIVGYTLGELQGQHHRIFLSPEERNSDAYEAFWRALRDGQYQQGEFKRLGKNGKEVWIQGSYNPILDENGKPCKVVKYATDITARKLVEAQIQRYMQALQRSNQELDDFAYIASHDLKEPIRGLSNNALFVLEDYAGKIEEDGTKRLKRMVHLCKRMEQLVDDLLYFSRLGRQDLAVQQVDLNQVIQDIVLMMETTLQEKNAEILISTPLPSITCDVPRVTEVFRNLITNAVKYNISDRKTVKIGLAPESTDARQVFYVKDNGIGIEERFYNDIFRIFKRLNEEDDSSKGTGVGLTFVKKIIERHGGSIWLNSAPGLGTTFYFTLNT